MGNCKALIERCASSRSARMRGSQMGWRIGVDIGGTFTDVALINDESGGIGIAKVPTTTQYITEGVTSGLREGLARYDIPPATVSLLSHATTVVTRLGQPDVISPSRMAEMLGVDKAGPKVRC